jgi:acyl dehydratase
MAIRTEPTGPRAGLAPNTVIARFGPFPVEWGKAREIAEATYDPAAEIYTPRQGSELPVVTPTYTMVQAHWGAGLHHLSALQLDPNRILDGEHQFSYYRHLRVGDWVTGTTRYIGEECRVGRAVGQMRRIVIETSFHRDDETLAVTDRRTILEFEQPPAWDRLLSETRAANVVESGAAGDSWQVGPFTHGAFLRYAGALGEFNAVHEDIDAARLAGYPDVFAQGMLIGGVLANCFNRRFGDESIKSFEVRFLAPAFRGDVCVISSAQQTIDGTHAASPLSWRGIASVRGTGTLLARARVLLDGSKYRGGL